MRLRVEGLGPGSSHVLASPESRGCELGFRVWVSGLGFKVQGRGLGV